MTITASISQAGTLIDTLKKMAAGEAGAGCLDDIAATGLRMSEAGQFIEACNVLGMAAALRGDSFEAERRFNAAIQHGGNDAWTLGNYAAALNILMAGFPVRKCEEPCRLAWDGVERRQSQFFDMVPGFFYTLIHHPDGGYSLPFASNGVRDLFGLEPETVRQDLPALFSQVHPGDIGMLQCKMEESVRGQTPCHVEFRIVHPAKGERWMEASSLPQRMADGGTRCDGFMHDITGRKRMEGELAAREREFRSLAENSPDNIVRWDVEGRYLYINPTHERTLGASASDVIGTVISDTHPHVKAGIAQVAASGQPMVLVRQSVLVNGELQIHEVSLVPERDAEGRIAGVLGLGRDITDICRMQESIAAREHEFRSLAESSPDFIVRYGCDGRIRYLNTVLVDLLGLDNAEEVIGKDPGEVWPDKYHPLAQAAARVAETGIGTTIEVVAHSGGGESGCHQICIVPERDVAGAIVGTIAFGRDISVIIEAEKRLKHFIDSLPGFAFTLRVTPDGHFSFPYASRGIHALYGLHPEDVKDDGAPLHALAHPDDRPRIMAAIFDAERTMSPFRIESRVCRPGLPERWLEVNSVPDRQADGSVLWYGIMLDITERKLAEQALEDSRTQLSGLIAQREGAREEERRYIAREIHDNLGQILSGLRLNLSRFARRYAAGSAEMMAHLRDAGELIDLAVKEVRNISAALRPVELEMDIRSALAAHLERFRAYTGIACVLHAGDEVALPGEDHKLALFRIVQESLTNVARHAKADRVEISLGMEPRHCVLSIRDNGAGFDTNEKKSKSFGLVGMRERAAMLGGSVVINSRPGQGTEIAVRIPARHNKEES